MQKYKMIAQGRVQGVGFRYGCYQWAKKFGIRGYVQNQLDGTVVIYAQSTDSQALAGFEKQVRAGVNNFCRVDYLDVTADNSKDFVDFTIR